MTATVSRRSWVFMRGPDYLGCNGILSAVLDDFQYREGQNRLADAVTRALHEKSILVAEAGTGVGKTYAYLIPTLLNGGRSVISTGTIALQDQLYERDIPLVSRVLGKPLRTALLKGRANYVCLLRYETERTQLRLSPKAREREKRRRLLDSWVEGTISGDLSECPIELNDPIERSQITSTAENCTGRRCPFYERCFVVEARRQALEADLIVTSEACEPDGVELERQLRQLRLHTVRIGDALAPRDASAAIREGEGLVEAVMTDGGSVPAGL